MNEEKRTLSCTDCGVLNCHKRNASYPEFCLTEKLTDEDILEALFINGFADDGALVAVH